jgi:hypothetical protein
MRCGKSCKLKPPLFVPQWAKKADFERNREIALDDRRECGAKQVERRDTVMQFSLSDIAASGFVFMENFISTPPEIKRVVLESPYNACEMGVDVVETVIDGVSVNSCVVVNGAPVEAHKSAEHVAPANHRL